MGKIADKTLIEMVKIKPGTFTMSRPVGHLVCNADEEIPHRVTIERPYLMGKFPVTQDEFKAVMQHNPSHFSVENGVPAAAGEIQGRRPVDCVSFYNAIMFCNKLSILEGLSPVYIIKGSKNPEKWGNVPLHKSEAWDAVIADGSADGYRLPTEEQWEYACMDAAINEGWHADNSGGKTHQTGIFAPNANGLYDMLGNVFEICWSTPKLCDLVLPGLEASDPHPIIYRVLRGGGWRSKPQILCAAYQLHAVPWKTGTDYGFRVVRGADEKE
ncbi:MAG: formylglycine-generating enzyme family protein [Spirochaetota bacterium]|jgi:formylglycine-generating enzyme required for sulfatase activity|nr:formylglycine-generating enzyme family protein [Spirochaetota bacterium]